MGDSTIGCFLSGGLDSSLVCAIASKVIPDMHAYTIGMRGSSDITAAKIVAEYLGIQHHIYEYTAEEGIAVIEDVIKSLETYDVTTVRASIPQYLLSKKIHEAGDVRVLLSGEGSDELFAGYQYFKNSPSAEALEIESDRLLKELYMYDNLRTDRVTAAWGLEVRVPFLDKALVEYVRNIHPDYRLPAGKLEKLLLRESFTGWLPDAILFRPKEAFSDAVSASVDIFMNTSMNTDTPVRTWKEVLADHISTFADDPDITTIDAPTLEAKYYRYIYNKHYKSDLITGYWMPKWITQSSWDPSATTIDCYQSGHVC
jgi:asparagine synthase (glutamine-hydrolysing)